MGVQQNHTLNSITDTDCIKNWRAFVVDNLLVNDQSNLKVHNMVCRAQGGWCTRMSRLGQGWRIWETSPKMSRDLRRTLMKKVDFPTP